jgi:hypothetical protein
VGVGNAQKVVPHAGFDFPEDAGGNAHVLRFAADVFSAVTRQQPSRGCRLVAGPDAIDGDQPAAGLQGIVRDPKELLRFIIFKMVDDPECEHHIETVLFRQ